MSRQAKLRNKAQARKVARSSGRSGPKGISGLSHRQAAPPWVRAGTRVPKAVKERRAKMLAEAEAAARESRKKAEREAVHEE